MADGGAGLRRWPPLESSKYALWERREDASEPKMPETTKEHLKLCTDRSATVKVVDHKYHNQITCVS